jgi:hypothetical protein
VVLRAELVRRSTVDVAVYEWAAAQAAAIASQWSALRPVLQAFRGVRKTLAQFPDLAPEAFAQVDVVIRYLEGIPSQRRIREWHRQHGGPRQDRWKWPVWTERSEDLVKFLEKCKYAGREERRASRDLTDADMKLLLRSQFAEDATARLLHARYPEIVPKDAGRLIALRIRR